MRAGPQATVHCRLDVVKRLLRSAREDCPRHLVAIVDAQRPSGRASATALMLSSLPALTRLLLRSGASVGRRDAFGKTALHYAATAGDAALAGLLLSAGAEAGAWDAQGTTPFHYAVFERHHYTALYLLAAHPPSRDARGFQGHTPLMLVRTVLYCTVLYCTVLYCTVLYFQGHTPLMLVRTVLCWTVLYCTVLYCTVLYCTVLYCTILYFQGHTPLMLVRTALCCTVLYCPVLPGPHTAHAGAWHAGARDAGAGGRGHGRGACRRSRRSRPGGPGRSNGGEWAIWRAGGRAGGQAGGGADGGTGLQASWLACAGEWMVDGGTSQSLSALSSAAVFPTHPPRLRTDGRPRARAPAVASGSRSVAGALRCSCYLTS
jgi:hypothetical protein